MPAVPFREFICFPGQVSTFHVLFTKIVLACAGRVDELLQAYDRERRVLPPPVRMWQWGWTKSAETWNGRIGAPPGLRLPCCSAREVSRGAKASALSI